MPRPTHQLRHPTASHASCGTLSRRRAPHCPSRGRYDGAPPVWLNIRRPSCILSSASEDRTAGATKHGTELLYADPIGMILRRGSPLRHATKSHPQTPLARNGTPPMHTALNGRVHRHHRRLSALTNCRTQRCVIEPDETPLLKRPITEPYVEIAICTPSTTNLDDRQELRNDFTVVAILSESLAVHSFLSLYYIDPPYLNTYAATWK